MSEGRVDAAMDDGPEGWSPMKVTAMKRPGNADPWWKGSSGLA